MILAIKHSHETMTCLMAVLVSPVLLYGVKLNNGKSSGPKAVFLKRHSIYVEVSWTFFSITGDSPVEVPDYLLRRKKIVHGEKIVEPAGVLLLGG